jgi:hypothetical protein
MEELSLLILKYDKVKLSTIKKPLNRQADKFDGQIFSMGFQSPCILRMTEWLQSKLSEQLH